MKRVSGKQWKTSGDKDRKERFKPLFTAVLLQLMRLQFNYRYFLIFALLLTTEILIALFVHDAIIRPYIGDLLVVILIYCFIKSFLPLHPFKTAAVVLLFALLVEVMQHFKLAELLGLQHSKAAMIILGSSFDWKDMLAYAVGTVLILLAERLRQWKPATTQC